MYTEARGALLLFFFRIDLLKLTHDYEIVRIHFLQHSLFHYSHYIEGV